MIDLAIIPARAGSKRVPGKNTRLLCGKPLIQWTVEAVEQSQCVQDYVITTDIPFVLEKYEKTIERPSWLCGDNVPMTEVIKDVLLKKGYQNFFESKDLPLTIGLFQPTTPMRSADDIDNSYTLYVDKNEGNDRVARTPVVSVCETAASKRMYTDEERPAISNTAYNKDVDKAWYMRNSAIFIFDAWQFILTNEVISMNPILYKMLKSRSIDIDTEEDWMMAEALMIQKLGKT